MDHEQSRFEFPLALASVRLSFHCTTALLEHGLLSPAKRHECAEALQQLHLDVEQLATDEDHVLEVLMGVRELIDRLEGHP